MTCGRLTIQFSPSKADIKKHEARLEQWDAAQAVHRQRVAAQEDKAQRAQEKAAAAAAAKGAHDLEV